MKVVEEISKWVGFVDALWGIATFLVLLSISNFGKIRKKYQLKKILFGRVLGAYSKIFISVPKFRGEILKRERDLVLFNEVALLLDINAFLSSIGIELETNVDELDVANNEIQIGGPVSNRFTNRYVNYYLKNFKWVVTKAHLDRYRADDNLKLLNYDFIVTSDDGKEGFWLGNDFYEYIPDKKGWAFIIKIVDRTNKRVIHLLFGCGANGTVGAVKFFVGHHDQIYRRNKNCPYIGVFEVDKKGVKTGEVTWLEVQDYLNYQ